MLRKYLAAFIAGLVFTTACVGISPQQPPKTLSILINDSDTQITFEYRSGGEWKKMTVDPQKDASITGDRIRVGTDREDKATITVDLPIQGGKKYRLFWNDPPGMWDFKIAS